MDSSWKRSCSRLSLAGMPIRWSLCLEADGSSGWLFFLSFQATPTDLMLDPTATCSINQVYIIGGDGTHRAADVLYKEIRQRALKISIACVPKTIDNDIGVIDRYVWRFWLWRVYIFVCLFVIVVVAVVSP